MLRRASFVAAAFVAAVLLTTSAAGAAVRPFNPPQTMVGGCSSPADAVVTTGGSLLGYATCPAAPGSPIRFFSRSPSGTVNPSQATGFSGSVLAVAYDNTATYVLFVSGSEVRIGKRTTAGAYSSRMVGTWSGREGLQGDVIARDGHWFGVWADEAESVMTYAGSTTAPAPVTNPPIGNTDLLPTLAYSGSIPVLIWTRTPGSAPGIADLMVSKYVSGAWQAPRVFASAGYANYAPDMQIVAGKTFVTWVRDDKAWVASNDTGSFTTHAFASGGAGYPTVGVSATGASVDHIFLSWTLEGMSPQHMFFAETASTGSVTGAWDGAVMGPEGIGVATGGFAGKATLVYSGQTALMARTQA